MSNLSNAEEIKQKIVEYIDVSGPSIPMKISNYFKIDSVIANAFLSELMSDRKIKMSHMRVGNSPLYYIRGQEFQLEKFVGYLGDRERDAFEILKERGVVEDSKMPPVVRVALRAIKDFAFPIHHRDNYYWRFLKLSDSQAIEMIDRGLTAPLKLSLEKKPEEKKDVKKEVIEIFDSPKEEVEEKKEVVDKPVLVEEGIRTKIETELPKQKGFEIEKRQTEFISPVEVVLPKHNLIEAESIINESRNPSDEVEKPKPKKRVRKKSVFVTTLLESLGNEGYEVVEDEKIKQKEYFAVSEFNGERFCVVGKDKKIITEKDLMLALKVGQKYKLPIIFVSRGEPNKKALDWLDYFGNLMIFKGLNQE